MSADKNRYKEGRLIDATNLELQGGIYLFTASGSADPKGGGDKRKRRVFSDRLDGLLGLGSENYRLIKVYSSRWQVNKSTNSATLYINDNPKVSINIDKDKLVYNILLKAREKVQKIYKLYDCKDLELSFEQLLELRREIGFTLEIIANKKGGTPDNEGGAAIDSSSDASVSLSDIPDDLEFDLNDIPDDLDFDLSELTDELNALLNTLHVQEPTSPSAPPPPFKK